jgi:hypothetical protein
MALATGCGSPNIPAASSALPLTQNQTVISGFSRYLVAVRRHPRQRLLRAKGPIICLAQAIGLGVKAIILPRGPTARPFATLSMAERLRRLFCESFNEGQRIPSPLGWAMQTHGPLARRTSCHPPLPGDETVRRANTRPVVSETSPGLSARKRQ